MMDSSDFLELLRALTHLSSTQLERAQQHIDLTQQQRTLS